MKLYPEISEKHSQFSQWRKDLHANPELAFEETRTAEFVVEKLKEVGIEVHTGVGVTGVVGTLKKGKAKKAIGLRADMDALPMQELNQFEHKSICDGKFHGCGHDGHTIMLLAAARYLAEHSDFNGTVNFIFQPAEEGKGGADAMIKDGLFEKFPVQSVYGMHNAPGVSAGGIAMRPGPMLAAYESFDITITGVGGHGAMPQHCVDPILISAQVVQSLQGIVSRNLDPLKAGVVSVTQIHAGDAYNVIPAEVKLNGAIRYLEQEVGEQIKKRMMEIITSTAAASGGKAELIFHELGYPPLINDHSCTHTAGRVARSLVAEENVSTDIDPIMGSEDFAYMLLEKPGCYVLIGNGIGSKGGCMVHHPEYDFNDDIIPVGASFWVKLVETELN